MTVAQPTRRYTVEEYYLLEEKAEYRSDYHDGEIFAMAGGSDNHSLICANLIGELHARLKGKPCAVFDPNKRLVVKPTGLRTYPDASVYCGHRETDPQDPTRKTLANPKVLIEVLSPGTELYDRRVKLSHYRKIESVEAILLISQEMPRVEAYTRHADGPWTIDELEGLDKVLSLPVIEVELKLSDIYDRIEFPAGGSIFNVS